MHRVNLYINLVHIFCHFSLHSNYISSIMKVRIYYINYLIMGDEDGAHKQSEL